MEGMQWSTIAINLVIALLNLVTAVIKIVADKKKTPRGGTRKKSKRKNNSGGEGPLTNTL